MPDFLQLYEDCSGMLDKVVRNQGNDKFLFVVGDSLFWFKSLFKRAPIPYSWEQNTFLDGTAYLDDSTIVCLLHNKRDRNEMNWEHRAAQMIATLLTHWSWEASN